jgi:hypothetical protein
MARPRVARQAGCEGLGPAAARRLLPHHPPPGQGQPVAPGRSALLATASPSTTASARQAPPAVLILKEPLLLCRRDSLRARRGPLRFACASTTRRRPRGKQRGAAAGPGIIKRRRDLGCARGAPAPAYGLETDRAATCTPLTRSRCPSGRQRGWIRPRQWSGVCTAPGYQAATGRDREGGRTGRGGGARRRGAAAVQRGRPAVQ